MRIEGATGGNIAQVNNDNQLLVKSTQRPLRQQKAVAEEAYVLYSNEVVFTGTAEADLLYIVNNDSKGRNIVITSFDMFVSGSTGGSMSYTKLGFYKNPTAGPSAVAGIQSNSNFSSAESVNLTLFTGDGSSAAAIAGAPIVLPINQQVQCQYSFSADTIIPLNKSIGFTITPPALNTSMSVSFLVSFFVEEKIK